MDLLSFSLLLQLAAPAQALPMPPPPPGMHSLSEKPAPLAMPPAPVGMRPLGPDEAEAIEAKATADDAAEPSGTHALAPLRSAEQPTLEAPAAADAPAIQAFSRLGLGNPLRARLEDGIEDWSLRLDHSPLDLAPVKDLSKFDVAQVASEYDIPVEMQPLVAQYIRFFQGPGRTWFRHWMERSHRYIPMMRPILEKAGLPGDTVYLAMIESGFSPDAASWAHAVGPWQFMAPTAKMFGLREDFWVDERRDPLKSTQAAAEYLSQLHDDLGDWYLAWAAYNTGGGRIRRLAKRRGTKDFWALSDGRGLAKETKHYVPKLIACALVAKHPQAFGFDADDFHYQEPLQFDEVEVVDPTDLAVIARAAGTTLKKVQELNPELRRWCTPPATEAAPYLLRVPKGSGVTLTENLAKLPPRQRLTYQVYKVRKGDTLGQIALRFHTQSQAILSMNRLSSARRLRINSELVVPIPQHGKATEIRVVVAPPQKTSPRRPSAPPHVIAAVVQKEPLVTTATPAPLALAPKPQTPAVSSSAVAKALAQARLRTPAHPKAVRAPPRSDVLAADRPRPMAQGSVLIETVDGRTRLTYGVSQGDTLWSISQRFRCTVEELRTWNHLGERARLQTGSSLTLWPTAQIVSSREDGHPWVAERTAEK